MTHKACHHCGTSVPLSEEICPQCSAFTGTVWWAIIAESAQFSAVLGEYLDLGKRYRLLSTDKCPFEEKWLQGMVLDCQPLQKSVFETLLAERKEDGGISAREPETTDSFGIPKLALPYLQLKEFCPTLPEVHEAWQEGNREVILLSDRRNWKLLSDILTGESLPTLQIVYWLNEMVTLWQALARVNCCQSLLVQANLRVDEDQNFSLQQLYSDALATEPTLKDLAQVWQQLLEHSGQEISQPLQQLLEDVADGNLETVTDLRLQLQDLANEQQEKSESEAQDTLIKTDEESPTPLKENPETDDISTAVVPMQLLSFTHAACTDCGRQRHHNEDSFGMQTQIQAEQNNLEKTLHARGLFIVCDGMGGHAAGEVASAMAVETLQNYFATHWQEKLPDRATINQGVLLANQTLYEVNQNNASSGSGRMGTTLVMAMVQDTQIAIAHVGDSRIYRVTRNGGLEQLTVDHEVGQRAIESGIEPQVAYSRPDAYQLTQALGPHDSLQIQPDIRFLDLQEDTLLLLCSDGLSDNSLLETHGETYLTPLISSSHNLNKGLRQLLEFGNCHNGHDNLTAIFVRIKVCPVF